MAEEPGRAKEGVEVVVVVVVEVEEVETGGVETAETERDIDTCPCCKFGRQGSTHRRSHRVGTACRSGSTRSGGYMTRLIRYRHQGSLTIPFLPSRKVSVSWEGQHRSLSRV